MSPEQALGRSTGITSDLFSFGIVLYEMIAGKHPWLRQTAIDTMHAIIHDAVPALPISTESVQALQATLEKALRKNPADRYQSADDMLNDLNRVRPQSEGGALASIGVVD